MICSNCGTTLTEEARFCHKCGQPVAGAKPAPQPQPESVPQPQNKPAAQVQDTSPALTEEQRARMVTLARETAIKKTAEPKSAASVILGTAKPAPANAPGAKPTSEPATKPEPAPQAQIQTLQLPDGTYTGEVSDGKPHGMGKLVEEDGTIGYGSWANGKPLCMTIINNEGCMVVLNARPNDPLLAAFLANDTYCDFQFGDHDIFPDASKADFLDVVKGYDTAHIDQDPNGLGTGVWNFADGSRYEGEFQDFAFNGHGVLTCKNGRVYEGDWKDGAPEGRIRYVDPSGSTYVGDWANDGPQGQGTWKSVNGYTYTGAWRNGKFHGKGKLVFGKEWSYEGEFENGERRGEGIYREADGYRYTGSWKSDTFRGHGKLVCANGEWHEGNWLYGTTYNGLIFKQEFSESSGFSDRLVHSPQATPGLTIKVPI